MTATKSKFISRFKTITQMLLNLTFYIFANMHRRNCKVYTYYCGAVTDFAAEGHWQ